MRAVIMIIRRVRGKKPLQTARVQSDDVVEQIAAADCHDPYVITVGAMKQMGTASRSDDVIASYSSKGPTAIDHIAKPDIVAPGNRVISLLGKSATNLQHSYPQNQVNKTYFVLSGTSMAAAVVSGSVADILARQIPQIYVP